MTLSRYPRLGIGSRVLAAILFATGMAAARDEPPSLVAPTEPRSPEEERAGFRLPPGFEAQLVAAEPDIAKPMNLAFDDLGRLWVTSSYEYPYPAAEGATPRDKVSILSDFGPEGRARSITTFADGLNIPIGVLPLSDREALVHSIPAISRLVDTDGDGRADRREPLYATFGFRDTHGMASAFTFGFDGWIYACHGFANDSQVAGADGEAVRFNSGNTYRIAPDGTHIEPWTRGQVNPFGLAFDALGNLYSCDCHSRPIYQLLRGAFYPSFGKPDDGLGYGPEMMTHDHGSTGIGGIAVYEADAFPAEYRGNIFVGNVVTNRINRDRLEWTGSTPSAVAEPDFVVSDDPWFRPVDIELGPDGALYVADFYNKIIGHYEVPLTHPGRDRERGRIWRIVYTGEDVRGAPVPHGGNWRDATVEELVADLGHPNLAVRLRSTRALVERDDSLSDVWAAVEAAENPWMVAHGLWVLHRRAVLDPTTLEKFSRSPDRLIRVHAMRILGETVGWRDVNRQTALFRLTDEDALVRRSAAEAFRRQPLLQNILPLIDLLRFSKAEDTHLIHAVRMALRDQLLGVPAFENDWKGDTRYVADVAPGVPTLASAEFLLDYVRSEAADEETAQTLTRYARHIARRGNETTDAALVAWASDWRADDAPVQADLLRAVHQGWQERGQGWEGEARGWALGRITGWLQEGSSIALGAELAGQLKLSEAYEPLERLATDAGASADRRGRALGSLAALDAGRSVETLARIMNDGAADIGLREQAAVLLGQSGRPEARAKLVESLATLPARLQAADAAALAGDRESAEALLAVIRAGKASARLLQVPAVSARLGQAGLEELETAIAELTRDLPPAVEAADALIAGRAAALARDAGRIDAERGAAVFSKHCAACHQIGGVGARVGPQLEGIGVRGPERLMEDILDPNRNVDQAFRATRLALDDGRILSGLITSDDEGSDAITIADSQGTLITLRREEIEERAVSNLSPMPANLADQIGESEFLDLIAYLLTRREAAPAP